MKNKKIAKLLLVGLAFAVLAATTLIISCEDDEESCDCTTKAHLGVDEICCGASDCTCTLQSYGNITVGNVKIPIYRESVVSNAVAITAAGQIVEGFTDVSDSRKNIIRDKVSAIHISATDDTATCVSDGNGKYIITLGANIGTDYGVEEIKNQFNTFTSTTLAIMSSQTKNTWFAQSSAT